MAHSRTNTMDKPWLPTYLERLAGLPFFEQTLALWLAYMADEDGVIDDIDWDLLLQKTGASMNHTKEVLRTPEIALYQSGLLERENRMIGQVHAKPLFRVRYDAEPQPA